MVRGRIDRHGIEIQGQLVNVKGQRQIFANVSSPILYGFWPSIVFRGNAVGMTSI